MNLAAIKVLPILLLLAGCENSTTPVPGAPEVMVCDNAVGKTVTMPDGTRVVTLSVGEGQVRAIIVLPPLPVSAEKVP